MPMSIPDQQSEFRVLVIGEAPGAEEDLLNKQFVGKTGKLLRDNIPTDWKQKVYFQNVVRCRPLSETRNNRNPTPLEIKCCSVFLHQDILSIRPHVLLLVGQDALQSFLPEANISKMRGIFFPVALKDFTCWAMATFHPSYVVRAERELWSGESAINPILPVFREDIKYFFDKVPEKANPPNFVFPTKTIIYPKSEAEALELFDKLEDPYALDFETNKLKPYYRDPRLLTAALSDGNLSFAFPVDWPGDLNPWGKSALRKMMSKKRSWVAQHGQFELLWLWATTGLFDQQMEDTEIVARLLHQRKGLGSLDVLSRIYFGIDIKDLTNNALAGQAMGPLDKTRLDEYSQLQILEYNALDSWAEIVLFKQMYAMLDNVQIANYRRIIATTKSITAMELEGLDVDLTESEKFQKDLFIKMQQYEKEARTVLEVQAFEKQEQKRFSLSKPATVAHVLVHYCHIELEKTEDGAYSVKEEVLEKYAGEHKLVDLRLAFVEVQKLKSTYVDPILSGEIRGTDGKIHGAYTAVHTATYRLSGTDPNMQNWPKRANKEIRRQILPPKGYIFAAFDYGQLEARTLVMASKDEVLKQQFIDKVDIHSKWLNRILEVYPSYIKRLAAKSNETEEAKIRKAGRDIIKTDFVFASLYGSVSRSVANRTGIPLDIVMKVHKEFWSDYRGVRAWIDGQMTRYQRYGNARSLNYRIRSEVLPGNEITNTPIQGTGAEIVLEAQNFLYEKSRAENDMCFMPRINVHDDLIFCLPDSTELDSYIEIIGREIVRPRFEFVNLPLTTECRIGFNWADLQSITTFTGQWYEKGQLIGVSN